MKKIALLLIIISIIVITTVHIFFWIFFALLLFIFGIITLFSEGTSEAVAKIFVEKLFERNIHKGFPKKIAFKGNQTEFLFTATETDTKVHTIKVYVVYNNERVDEHESSVGLKRNTVCWDDYKSPHKIDNFYNGEKFLLALHTITKRKLLEYDKVKNTARYETFSTREEYLEVYMIK